MDDLEGWSGEEEEWEEETAEVVSPEAAPVVLTPEQAQKRWEEGEALKLTRQHVAGETKKALQQQLKKQLARETALKAKFDQAAEDAEAAEAAGLKEREAAEQKAQDELEEFVGAMGAWFEGEQQRRLERGQNRTQAAAEEHEWNGQTLDQRLASLNGEADAWLKAGHAERLLRDRRLKDQLDEVAAAAAADFKSAQEVGAAAAADFKSAQEVAAAAAADFKSAQDIAAVATADFKSAQEVTAAATADFKSTQEARQHAKHVDSLSAAAAADLESAMESRVKQRQAEEQRLRDRISKASEAMAEALAAGLEERRLEARILEQRRLRKNLEKASAAATEAVNAGQEEGLETDDQFYRDGLEEAERSLPAAVDWRNATDGKDYLEAPMEQGSCGSCWAVAGIRMLTARHRIARREPKIPAWSVAFPLYCSEFNQGCEGGYGYLGMRWSEEIGLLPSECAAYRDETAGRCEVDDECVSELKRGGTQRWRAKNSRYVGGQQRQATQAALMKELSERGPVVATLDNNQIGNDFMYYAGGVYFGEETPSDEHSPGGHAVLLAGYGEEQGMKYWLVQNSWGDEWGEGGYVRLSRDAISLHTAAVADSVEDEQHGQQVERALAQARKQPLPPPP